MAEGVFLGELGQPGQVVREVAYEVMAAKMGEDVNRNLPRI
jgi:hypothetical protein